MPRNQAFDNREDATFAYPYAPNLGYLTDKPALTSGYDVYSTWGGTTRKRLGTTVFGSTTAMTIYPVRCWFYETLENSPVVYLVGSFLNSAFYELRYQKISGGGSGWTLVTERRACNQSIYPHEACAHRGKLYVKGFPTIIADPTGLGSIVLDGTGGTMSTHDWGALGPSSPVALTYPSGRSITAGTNANPTSLTSTAHRLTTGETILIAGGTGSWAGINGNRVVTVTGANTFTIPVDATGFGGFAGTVTFGWPASAHAVTVLNSWTYSYTWSLKSGHETDRAPLQTNPDLAPSSIGAFTNRLPTMTVVGPSDTTEYPYLNIYRTTDGGGTFFLLKQIANTGGTIIFVDKYLASASGNADPLPDSQLDTSHVAPTEFSNGPPPAVAPPLVTGTDAIQRSTPIIEYASRLWYAIGEYIFYSANEELNEGVPEEAWPAGIALPNFFRAPETVTKLIPTPSGLIIPTRKQTVKITGTNKATFNMRPFLGGVGGAYGQPLASAVVGEKAAWLTQDSRIAVVSGDNYADISKPLGSAFKTLVDAGAIMEMYFWAQGDKEWLIVAAQQPSDTTASRWLIFDLDKSMTAQVEFWFPPWRVRSTTLAVGQNSVLDTENKLIACLWNGVNFQAVKIDPTGATASDPDPTTLASTGFSWNLRTSLRTVPVGDHVNTLRAPGFSPTLASVALEKTSYTGDAEPAVNVYLDNFFTVATAMTLPADPPAGRDQSTDFLTLVHHFGLNRNCKYAAIEITGAADTAQAEIHRLQWSWLPESGR